MIGNAITWLVDLFCRGLIGESYWQLTGGLWDGTNPWTYPRFHFEVTA